jgi:hypothetical protein
MGVGSLKRDWILYPDDPANGWSWIRAWDRFLLSIGLLPIGTSDLTKVGPILVDPNGTREYQDYYIDDCGYIKLGSKVLPTSGVRKASSPKRGRVRQQVQATRALR